MRRATDKELYSLAPILVLAAETTTAAEEEGGGSFLVEPGVGLMIWTLVAFGITLLILRRFAFPAIGEFLDKRANAIAESVEQAERTRAEADEILAEYRHRLKEAREQADDIIARAHRAAESVQSEAAEQGRAKRDELVDSAKAEIAAETRRSLDRIRREIADLTVIATEKVTRKTLDSDDHRKLVEEALQEVDFSALTGGNGGGADG